MTLYREGRREALFWSRVDKRPDGCWQWTGSINNAGYAVISSTYVHRYAYELLVGPIPEGLTLDHLCRNRPCVNPAHLEPVTMRENTLRGNGPAAQRHRQTLCQRGHVLIDRNGKRVCQECQRIRSRLPATCPLCGRSFSRATLGNHKRLPHPLRHPERSHPGTSGRPRMPAA